LDYTASKSEYSRNGFAIINDVFSSDYVNAIIHCLENADKNKPTFRITNDLFAIRQFLKELPDVNPRVFTSRLKDIIKAVFGSDYFVVKSIYFDKPGLSNWFVAYHQDLTISVNKKVDLYGYGPWTVKHSQFAVQPPLDILQRNFTIRIHLDDTNEHNGALKVIPGSHLKGIYRPETIDWNIEKECICNVKAGGVMLMSPLLLHASNRTTNNNKRRVLHIEFSNAELPAEINWSEKINIFKTKFKLMLKAGLIYFFVSTAVFVLTECLILKMDVKHAVITGVIVFAMSTPFVLLFLNYYRKRAKTVK
jgi:hypothetical protein